MNKNVIINQEIGDLFKIGYIIQDVFKKMATFQPYLNKNKTFEPNFKFNSEQINNFFKIAKEIKNNDKFLERIEKFFWDKVEHRSPGTRWNLLDSSYISDFIGEMRDIAKKSMIYKDFVLEEEWQFTEDKQLISEINDDREIVETFEHNIEMLNTRIGYLIQSISDALFHNSMTLQLQTNFQ